MVRFGSTSGDGASTSGDGASTSGDGASTSGDGASTSGDGANTTGDGINAAGEQAKASLSEHVNKMMQSAGRWALWFARGINCNYPAAYGPSATGGEIASANLPGL
ncbi:MAG: hypothetical protein HQ546_02950, partial [Planctomycetes bacterium]|nr:hypothetical protein [Planctomycetota bacterium]